MKKITIIAFLIIVTGQSHSYAAEIPFTLEKGLIIFTAKIKKDVPIEVAMSTGATQSVISWSVISKHKIQLAYTSVGWVTGQNDKTVSFAEVSQIIVGDEESTSLNMKMGSFDAMNKLVGREIGAILGADYFRGRILQIDFNKKVLRFFKKSPVDYKAAKSSPVSADKTQIIFKMDLPFRTFDGLELTMPVVFDISFNGTKVRSLFDTGVAMPITLSPSAVKEYSFGDVPGKGLSNDIKFSTVDLKGFKLVDVPGQLVGKDAGFDKGLSEYGAIIGLGVLQNFIVTFDWKNKVIVLEK